MNNFYKINFEYKYYYLIKILKQVFLKIKDKIILLFHFKKLWVFSFLI